MRVVREILGYSPTLHAQTRKEEAPPRSPRGAPPLGAATDLKGLLEGLVGVARRRSVPHFCVVSDFLRARGVRARALARRREARRRAGGAPRRARRRGLRRTWASRAFKTSRPAEAVLVDTGAPEVRANYKKSMLALHAARTAPCSASAGSTRSRSTRAAPSCGRCATCSRAARGGRAVQPARSPRPRRPRRRARHRRRRAARPARRARRGRTRWTPARRPGRRRLLWLPRAPRPADAQAPASIHGCREVESRGARPGQSSPTTSLGAGRRGGRRLSL